MITGTEPKSYFNLTTDTTDLNRHPIPRPHGRAMGCLLWGFGNKLTVIRAPHCTLKKTFTDCGQNWACWWPSAGTVINKFGSCVYEGQILEEMLMIDKSQMTKMSFYQHGLTVIPEWTSHHMPNKVWDGMIYPFPWHHCKFGNGK